METIQTVILIFLGVISLIILIKVSQVRNKSCEIISFGLIGYHFDIINGPSVEEIFKECEWDQSYGFELVPPNEPLRSLRHPGLNQLANRRVISYFVAPSSIYNFRDMDSNNKRLYPWQDTKEFKFFLERKEKNLEMEAVIYKEPRGYIKSYFGGGGPAYGTTYKLKITYNINSRTGKMIITED